MYSKFVANKLFQHLNNLHAGRLTLITPDGQTRTFEGKTSGDHAKLELYDWRVISNMISHGDIGLAEDYRAGRWQTDNLVTLLNIGMTNKTAIKPLLYGTKLSQLKAFLLYLFKLNTIRGSRRNIHAHYDLGNDFYQLWLDKSMTYSSGIYHTEQESLQQAQNNKYDRILEQLNKASGSLLEIGCGWGGFAERATQQGDFAIKGITLSEQQHAFASQRLEDVNIALEDYRHQQGIYDHIVSIEMFEAVGERYWPQYFAKIKSLLSKQGKAVIQTITIDDKNFPNYRKKGDFIRSFIFPGGLLPSPSRFKQEVEKAGLRFTEKPFFFANDYARTLQQWLNNFDAKTEQIKALGFDDGFIRLWRFYLAGCIAGFSHGPTDVMQVELSHA